MPLIIPTPSLEKLKKFPSQILIVILIILLVYFINSNRSSDKEITESWKQQAIKNQRLLDSTNKAFSKFRDEDYQRILQEVEFYRKGAGKIDSITKVVIQPKIKKLVKRK